jgi:CheY-like chemotaxis protein
MRTVLWIDDSLALRKAAQRMLSHMEGVECLVAESSGEAEAITSSRRIDCVVTDILRRNADQSVSKDDGYVFFRDILRPQWPTLPVIFHTKNLPTSFAVDAYSQYLSKWEPEEKKAIELEPRLSEAVKLYDAFAHEAVWARIEPRLVRVRGELLSRLERWADVWKLNPKQFEQFVAELLDKMGFDVLWIPGGNDQGIDIVAGSRDASFLIDVKQYSQTNPVQVELVRHVYGVAAAVQQERPERQWHGGIITSSRFTSGAQEFRRSARVRPLLRDGEWLRDVLGKYVPLRM